MPKRDYDNDYPSVTEVLGVLRKIGLENWFKYTPYAQIKKESEEGKLIGTQIHEAIEAYIATGEVKVSTQYPEQVMNALKGFMQYRKENETVKLKNSEIMMTSNIHRFNGTLDCIGEINGTPVIFDWKTGKAKEKDKPDIYDEYKYQVSAYVYAYNEVYQSNVKQAIILSLAKDKVSYNTYTLGIEEIDYWFHGVFIPALTILENQKGGSIWVTR